MLKKIIKSCLSKEILDRVKKNLFYKIFIAKSMYNSDRNRLIKYAYSFGNAYTHENLRAKMTFHYHAIEKGLSNPNLRLGFGTSAFEELFWAMDMYILKGFPTDDFRFQVAISVIKSYLYIHKINNYCVDYVENKFSTYSKFLNIIDEKNGGAKKINFENLNFVGMDFKNLISNRYSVRDYGSDTIDRKVVFKAIELAEKTPSACNRQPWKLYYITNKELMETLLAIQGGLKGNGKNIQGLLLITVDKQYVNSAYERNQTYVDGGFYSMSLIYALTSFNIATCPLHAFFNVNTSKIIKKLLHISDSEDLINFISLGSFPSDCSVAISSREDYTNYTRVIE